MKYPINVTYIYLRGKWNKPAAYLLSGNEPSIGIKFHPKLFKLKKDSLTSSNLANLPYMMIFAVATLTDVIIYTTERYLYISLLFYLSLFKWFLIILNSLRPIALLKDMHYAEITDIAWSHDGLKLIVTSQDGYCTLVKFNENELGEELEKDKYPFKVQQEEEVEVEVSPPSPPQKVVQEGEDKGDENLMDVILSSEKKKKRRIELVNLSDTLHVSSTPFEEEGTKTKVEEMESNKIDSSEPLKKKRRVTLINVTEGLAIDKDIQIIPMEEDDKKEEEEDDSLKKVNDDAMDVIENEDASNRVEQDVAQ